MLYAHAPTRLIGAAMVLFGPGACLAGLAGIIYPPTVLDPTMDHSKLDREQLLREVATWPILVGLLCWIAGIAIGVHLLRSRG